MQRFYLSLKRHQHVADITNRCLRRPARASRFSPLFNGKDLTGWEHVGPRSFSVEHGLLKSEGGMGLLWYTPEKIGKAAGGADIGL